MVSKRKPEADEHPGDHDEYEPLEAEAVADDAEARHEAEELDDVTADFPLDEDVESASPTKSRSPHSQATTSKRSCAIVPPTSAFHPRTSTSQ